MLRVTTFFHQQLALLTSVSSTSHDAKLLHVNECVPSHPTRYHSVQCEAQGGIHNPFLSAPLITRLLSVPFHGYYLFPSLPFEYCHYMLRVCFCQEQFLKYSSLFLQLKSKEDAPPYAYLISQFGNTLYKLITINQKFYNNQNLHNRQLLVLHS